MSHKQCMKSYKNNHSTTKLDVSEAAINFCVEGTLKINDLVKKPVTVLEVLYGQSVAKTTNYYDQYSMYIRISRGEFLNAHADFIVNALATWRVLNFSK